jgi:outer membrane protein OmpA-like peptidoglycan-associated protein
MVRLRSAAVGLALAALLAGCDPNAVDHGDAAQPTGGSIAAPRAIGRDGDTVSCPVAADDKLAQGHALLIGSWDYADRRWARLSGIPLELDELQSEFCKHFQTVTRLDQPTFARLDSGLVAFLRTYGNQANSRLLIYYAGHGYTELDPVRNQDRGFITAVDTPFVDGSAQSYDDARQKAMSLQLVRDQVADASALQILMIFDSCFSGAIFSLRAPPPPPAPLTEAEIEHLIRQPVRQFITAGDRDEQVPADSPIPKILINALDGAADFNRTGVISATMIGIYMAEQARLDSLNLTPRVGKLPDPNFSQGDFLFRTDQALRAQADAAAPRRPVIPQTAPPPSTTNVPPNAAQPDNPIGITPAYPASNPSPNVNGDLTVTVGPLQPRIPVGPAPGSQVDLAINIGDRVFFDSGSADLTDNDGKHLDRVADWLKKYPALKIQIAGHSDSNGSREQALAIGARRAEAVATWLKEDGIDASRLSTVSYGMERPVAQGDDESAAAGNRAAIISVTE